MTEPRKVIFAPGCFDHIEVESQEELDNLVAEIQRMFETMTAEEIMAQSQEISLEELAEAMDVDPEEIEALVEQELNSPRLLQ